jgi:hypothetical protein
MKTHSLACHLILALAACSGGAARNGGAGGADGGLSAVPGHGGIGAVDATGAGGGGVTGSPGAGGVVGSGGRGAGEGGNGAAGGTETNTGRSVDGGGSGGSDAGIIYVIPPSDSGTSPSQACLASPFVANCPVVDVRYYFNRDVGKCAQTQACEATENTFATVAECETACIRILNCSCTVGAGACDSQGLCGTCPSPNLLANLTDTASGLACVNPGLICHVTTADTVLWRCRCLAGAKSTTWECVIPISG